MGTWALRVPTELTVLKWLFCLLTALLVSLVAFFMSLSIAAAYEVRFLLINSIATGESLQTSILIYGSFNVLSATLGSLCVVCGAERASGSGLAVRPLQKARKLKMQCGFSVPCVYFSCKRTI
jgi:hypothetical protein